MYPLVLGLALSCFQHRNYCVSITRSHLETKSVLNNKYYWYYYYYYY